MIDRQISAIYPLLLAMSDLSDWARAISEVGLVPLDRVKALLAVCEATYPISKQSKSELMGAADDGRGPMFLTCMVAWRA